MQQKTPKASLWGLVDFSQGTTLLNFFDLCQVPNGKFNDFSACHADDFARIPAHFICQLLQEPKGAIGQVEGAFDSLVCKLGRHGFTSCDSVRDTLSD
jgi:hypothetical protein